MSRLRTTWAVAVLSEDVRISEYLAMAGTTNAKSLEQMAKFVQIREDQVSLRKAAGLG